MKVKAIRSEWLSRDGRRLDCGPYLSGALEARDALDRLRAQKVPLKALTKGYAGGIYNGPQFRRNYVASPTHGVQFLSSGSMLLGDFSTLPLLRKRDAESAQLRHLQLHSGTTLISCSGTVGRMTYVRPDMEGMWSSQDVMKVVTDRDEILPGYLHAFLSSKYGVPLVVSGTYGAIIQHIEPKHIEELPVPRFGPEIELAIHELVDSAAKQIAASSELKRRATSLLLSRLGMRDLDGVEWQQDRSALGWSEAEMSSESLRALNYDPRAMRIRRTLSSITNEPLGGLCEPKFFKGKIIFTRIETSPEHGVMLLGQRNAFHLFPDGRWISAKSVAQHALTVPEGTTLIPSHGTLGEFELYCRALLVTKRLSQYAFSGDFFRCVPLQKRVRSGYLFAFLRSRMAFRMLRSISIGGKQQEQHPAMMYRVPIPRFDPRLENEIADLVDEASSLYDAGLMAEDLAREKVEQEIEAIGG